MVIWEQKRGHPKTRDRPKKAGKDTMSTQSSAYGSLSLPEAQQVIKVQELRVIIEANVPCQGVGDGLRDGGCDLSSKVCRSNPSRLAVMSHTCSPKHTSLHGARTHSVKCHTHRQPQMFNVMGLDSYASSKW